MQLGNNICISNGEAIIIDVRAQNKGNKASPNSFISFSLPAGVSYNASTLPLGTFNSTTNVWTIGTLNTGDDYTAQFSFVIPDVTALEQQIVDYTYQNGTDTSGKPIYETIKMVSWGTIDWVISNLANEDSVSSNNVNNRIIIGSICSSSEGDNLGDHTATQDIDLNNFSLLNENIPVFDNEDLAEASLGIGRKFRWSESNLDGVPSPDNSTVGMTG